MTSLHRLAAVGTLAVVVAAGCSSSTSKGSSGGSGTGKGQAVDIVLTNAGCTVSVSSAPAGPFTFSISNHGDGATTEVELMRGGRIVAERENMAPGIEGSFSATLEVGTYSVYCPGGSGPADHPFTVVAAPRTSP